MENDSIALLVLLNKSQGVYMENIDTQTFYNKNISEMQKQILFTFSIKS